MVVYGCHGSYGHYYDCYATNVTTLFKNGVPIETFTFCDTQCTEFPNEYVKVEDVKLTKGPLTFSKDSVLNSFRTEREYVNCGWCFDTQKEHGVIVEPNSKLFAPTLFVTSEGYKFLELYDYDSVTMVFTFDNYIYAYRLQQETIDKLTDKGYKFY